MEDNKKRAANSAAKTESPKKQRVSKKGAKGKTRDPNLPKRPMTAYFLYLQDFRAEIAIKKKAGEEVPSKIGDVAKQGAKIWKAMKTEKKQSYVEKYEKNKKIYDEEVKKTKPQRDSDKPKKPKSAFFYFLNEFREKQRTECVQQVEGKTIPGLAGEKWQKMNATERKSYVDLASAAGVVYKVDLAAYNVKVKAKEKAAKQSAVKPKETSDSDEDDEDDDEDDNDDDDDDEEDDDSD